MLNSRKNEREMEDTDKGQDKYVFNGVFENF